MGMVFIIALKIHAVSRLTIRKATEVQPYYAPELKIAGAAIGGIVANLKAPPGK